ncbi:MAG: hypothetical protein ACOYXM_06825 [Actinomycetota bacterium]
MPSQPWSSLSRRQFLAGGGAAAGALLLAACGGGDDGVDAAATTQPGGALALAQFFGGPMFVPGREVRLPFGVADQDGLLSTERTPKRLMVEVRGPDDAPVGEPVEVERHAQGLPRAYFPLLATFPEPGLYTARAEIEGVGAEMSVKVDAPEDVKVIQVGQSMPALQTPTTAESRGVNPICTREPACPLHDVTLAEALTTGRPTALLVASPAFCQLAICGPVLDVLLSAIDDYSGIGFLHAEVYVDPKTDTNTHAPVVGELGLHFEPCLVLVGADGKVFDRVDTIYDEAELRERLDRLA